MKMPTGAISRRQGRRTLEKSGEHSLTAGIAADSRMRSVANRFFDQISNQRKSRIQLPRPQQSQCLRIGDVVPELLPFFEIPNACVDFRAQMSEEIQQFFVLGSDLPLKTLLQPDSNRGSRAVRGYPDGQIALTMN
jgi:hypothetical protein